MEIVYRFQSAERQIRGGKIDFGDGAAANRSLIISDQIDGIANVKSRKVTGL